MFFFVGIIIFVAVGVVDDFLFCYVEAADFQQSCDYSENLEIWKFPILSKIDTPPALYVGTGFGSDFCCCFL